MVRTTNIENNEKTGPEYFGQNPKAAARGSGKPCGMILKFQI